MNQERDGMREQSGGASPAKHISMELKADGARVTSLSMDGGRLVLVIEAELASSQLRAGGGAPDANPAPPRAMSKPAASATTTVVRQSDDQGASAGAGFSRKREGFKAEPETEHYSEAMVAGLSEAIAPAGPPAAPAQASTKDTGDEILDATETHELEHFAGADAAPAGDGPVGAHAADAIPMADPEALNGAVASRFSEMDTVVAEEDLEDVMSSTPPAPRPDAEFSAPPPIAPPAPPEPARTVLEEAPRPAASPSFPPPPPAETSMEKTATAMAGDGQPGNASGGGGIAGPAVAPGPAPFGPSAQNVGGAAPIGSADVSGAESGGAVRRGSAAAVAEEPPPPAAAAAAPLSDDHLGMSAEESSTIGGDRHGEPTPSISFGTGAEGGEAPPPPAPPSPPPASVPPPPEGAPAGQAATGGTTVLIRYTCPKCKTQGMQAVDKVGTVVNCSNCGKAMRLVMKK